MSRQTGIRCRCGHRITAREVLKHGIMMADWRPIYVYIRFRCSHCGRQGEHLVDYLRWDQSVLANTVGELSPEERARLEGLPPIGTDEIIEFARGLTHARLADLMPERARERSFGVK
jgi:hypothetical protein